MNFAAYRSLSGPAGCNVYRKAGRACFAILCPRPRGYFGIARSVRLSVLWHSCLRYRHAGCLQLSHRRPPEKCGLRTRPRTDVDLPRFLDLWTDADGMIGGETICHRRTPSAEGGILSRRPRAIYSLVMAYGTDGKVLTIC